MVGCVVGSDNSLDMQGIRVTQPTQPINAAQWARYVAQWAGSNARSSLELRRSPRASYRRRPVVGCVRERCSSDWVNCDQRRRP
jgi:hypothetical protein